MTATASREETRLPSTAVEPLAWFALIGVLAYVAVDVLLMYLRPRYSLLYNAESDYGRGPWFWLMDLNFLLRCALSLAVVWVIARTFRLDGRARIGLVLLAAWGACSGLLAFFADDVEGQTLHGSGVVHIWLALIAFACVMVGTILTSVSLRADPQWRSAAATLLVVSLLGLAAFLLLGHAFHHRHAPGGLYERIFLGTELAWFAITAGYLAFRREPPAQQ